jgi:chloramphenicol 3-O-phosphotransferase
LIPASVVVITGVMAAGKSTVAQRLAERLPRAAHVRGDVFRRMIVSGRSEFVPAESAEAGAQLKLRYQISASVADAYAKAGFTAIVQDVILGADLTEYLDMVTTRPRLLVVLAPSPETVERREAGRAKKGYGEWTVEALDASLRTETPRLGLWIDTSAQTPDETVTQILAGLSTARLPD